MATVDSVEFYMFRAATRTGYNVYVELHAATAYNINPASGTLLGTSASVSVDSIPLFASAAWVTFTFTSPVDISDASFYGVVLQTDAGTDYAMAGLYIFGASDWSDATTGTPYDGKERAWTTNSSGVWSSGDTRAYRINCTDATDNYAQTPTASYYNAFDVSGQGVRTYVDPDTTVVDAIATVVGAGSIAATGLTVAQPRDITVIKRLVAAAADRFWYENI